MEASMTMKAATRPPASRVASGRVKVPSPQTTPVPTRHASGTPVRPTFIRALLQEQKAFDQLATNIDKLCEVIGSVAESGAPPPLIPPEGQKK
jgi:hypothetical protein